MVFCGPVDESVHPELQRKARQFLHPLRDRPFQKALTLGSYLAVDVVDAPDLLWLAPGIGGGIIYKFVQAWQAFRRRPEERRHPSVREASDQGEHPGSRGPDPDPDIVSRMRSRPVALERVEIAIEARGTLFTPDEPHDLYSLLDGAHRLTVASSRPAHRRYGVPESSGSLSHRDATTGEHVERGCRLR